MLRSGRKKGAGGGELVVGFTVRSAGTCVTSLPLLRFSQSALGSRPTRQLVSMRMPARPSTKTGSLPPPALQLAPRQETAQFIFSLVVPLRWRWGPCHASADVLGEGP